LGSLVPTQNNAVKVLAYDGVRRGFDDRRKKIFWHLTAITIAHSARSVARTLSSVKRQVAPRTHRPKTVQLMARPAGYDFTLRIGISLLHALRVHNKGPFWD
jgi:hypothetical protein